MKKTVKFTNKTLTFHEQHSLQLHLIPTYPKFSITTIEKHSLSILLRETRKSDLRQRQANKLKFERLLSPVLEEGHRLIARLRQLNLNF